MSASTPNGPRNEAHLDFHKKNQHNVTAAALSLTVSAAGSATTKITVLLTAEEIDAAAK